MNNSIENLEAWISENILSKGETYWVNDQVQNLEQDEDVWVATVYGADSYMTQVTVNNGQVEDWDCDCPYDWGPICKHVAAVLLAVQEEVEDSNLLSAEEAALQTNQLATKAAKKEAATPLEQIIEKLDEAELRRLLTFFAKRQEEVRAHLLSKYSNLLEVVSKEQFKQLVSSYINSYSGGQYGFLEYRDTSRLGDKLYNLVSNVDYDNPMAVVYLCEAVIEQVALVAQNADDSSGSLGGAMEEAFHALTVLTEREEELADEAVLKYIFEYAIGEANKEIYQRGGWADSLRAIACEAANNKQQVAQVIEMLDQTIKIHKTKEYGKYEVESAERLKLATLKEHYSSEVANEYLYQHLHYSSFRKKALEQAMEEKRYEEVKRLAEDGIVHDTGKHAGLVNVWKKWLIDLHKTTGDSEAYVQLNEELFFDRGEMEYYRKIKEVVPKAEFKQKIETYIQHYRKKEGVGNKPRFNEYVARILEEENRLEDLMAEVKKTPSLHYLDRYFKLLSEHFKTDFINFYEQLVRQYMDRNTGRGHYQQCCQYVDKIVRLGGLENAKQLVADWRKQYPRRRAMIEELARYKWS